MLCESVTVDVPVSEQALVAEVELIFGANTTVLVTVLLEAIVDEQANETELPLELAAFVNEPDAIAVTVIVVEPDVVKPVAVKVPDPAVVMVIVAVLPVCEGDEVL